MPEDSVDEEPYLPGEMSRRYQRLSPSERSEVDAEVDRRFQEETGIDRQLDWNSREDRPLCRRWLRIRDQVMMELRAQQPLAQDDGEKKVSQTTGAQPLNRADVKKNLNVKDKPGPAVDDGNAERPPTTVSTKVPDSFLQTPGVAVKFSLRKVKGLARPLGAVIITPSIEFSFKGKVYAGDPHSSVQFEKGKVRIEFIKKVKTTYGELKIKSSADFKPGEAASAAVSIGDEEWQIEIAAHADPTELFSVGLKRTFSGKKKIGEFTFQGEIEGKGSLLFSPNPLWPGWVPFFRAVGEGGLSIARKVGPVVRYIGDKVSGLFAEESAGAGAVGTGAAEEGLAVSALGTGILVTGVAAALVTWTLFGLYEIGEAHRKGREQAILVNFNTGYANMLATLTSKSLRDLSWTEQAEIRKLLSADYKEDFDKACGDLRGSDSSDLSLEQKAAVIDSCQEKIEEAGRSKVVHDVDHFINTFDRIYGEGEGLRAWQDFAELQRKKYGEAEGERAEWYRTIVRRQLAEGKVEGIPFETDEWIEKELEE